MSIIHGAEIIPSLFLDGIMTEEPLLLLEKVTRIVNCCIIFHFNPSYFLTFWLSHLSKVRNVFDPTCHSECAMQKNLFKANSEGKFLGFAKPSEC